MGPSQMAVRSRSRQQLHAICWYQQMSPMACTTQPVVQIRLQREARRQDRRQALRSRARKAAHRRTHQHYRGWRQHQSQTASATRRQRLPPRQTSCPAAPQLMRMSRQMCGQICLETHTLSMPAPLVDLQRTLRSCRKRRPRAQPLWNSLIAMGTWADTPAPVRWRRPDQLQWQMMPLTLAPRRPSPTASLLTEAQAKAWARRRCRARCRFVL